MYLAGSKQISEEKVNGYVYGFDLAINVDQSVFSKKGWEKNKLKILKQRHQDHCREKGIQYNGLSHKHLISKTS